MLLLHLRVQTVPTSGRPYRGIFLHPTMITVLGMKRRGQQRLLGLQPVPGLVVGLVPGTPGTPGIPGMGVVPPPPLPGGPVGISVPPGSVTPDPSIATQVGIGPCHIPSRPQITFVGPLVRNPGGQITPQDSPPCPGVQTPTRYPPGGATSDGHVDLVQ